MRVFQFCTLKDFKSEVTVLVKVQSSYLLRVVGHVGQHGGDVEHDLVALVGGVQGVGACRIS